MTSALSKINFQNLESYVAEKDRPSSVQFI